MLRILYVPVLSSKTLAACGSFNASKVYIRNIVEQNEDVVFYFAYPDREDIDVSALSHFDGLDRVIRVPMSVSPIGAVPSGSTDQSFAMFYTPLDLIDKFRGPDGKYVVDVLITESSRAAYFTHLVLNDHVKCADQMIPLITFHQFQSIKEAHMAKTSDDFEYAQYLGALSGWNVWGCRTKFEAQMRSALKWFKPSVVDQIRRRTCYDVNTPIDCERIDRFMQEKPKDKCLINFGSRWNSTYFLDEIIEEFDYMYKAGRDVRFVVTSPSRGLGNGGGRLKDDIDKLGFPCDFTIGLGQEDFYKIASQCHIAPFFGKYGELGLSIRERAYMRVAPVVPNAPLFDEMFPTWKYKYDSKQEMRAIIRYLQENYWSKDVQEELDILREDMRVRYGGKESSGRYITFIRKVKAVEDEGRVKRFERAAQLLTDLFDKNGWPQRLTHDELRAFIAKHTDTKLDMNVTWAGTSRMLYRGAMPLLGYRDVGIESPVYVRQP
jgi:hypothetical protein